MEGSAGQVKNGKEARWNRAQQWRPRSDPAGLIRHSKLSTFRLCTVVNHLRVSSRGVTYVICFHVAVTAG